LAFASRRHGWNSTSLVFIQSLLAPITRLTTIIIIVVVSGGAVSIVDIVSGRTKTIQVLIIVPGGKAFQIVAIVSAVPL
jgi:hypothetical protein